MNQSPGDPGVLFFVLASFLPRYYPLAEENPHPARRKLLAINVEIDRLLNKARSTLVYVSGSLSQTMQGLDEKETNGLAEILTGVLEILELVHRLILEDIMGGTHDEN